MKSFEMVESFSVCFCSGDSSCLYKLLPTVFCNEKVKALIMISTIKNHISFVGCGDCLNKWTVQSCLSLCWNLLQWFIWCPDWDYLSTILCGIALWCLQNTYGVVKSWSSYVWRLKYWMAGGTGDQHIGDQIFALTAVKLSCVHRRQIICAKFLLHVDF